MTQDPDIGVVTKADLAEGIRVNEALLTAARGDIEYLEARLASADERIEFQMKLKEEWRNLATLAPERIERITATLTRQRQQLAAMPQAAVSRPSVSQRAERVAQLTARIAKGDMTALAELTKLAS